MMNLPITTTIIKDGDGEYVMLLPEVIVQEYGLRKGDELDGQVVNGRLEIRVAHNSSLMTSSSKNEPLRL
jgi:antitoxin component of MazEF toxin-antitoxin module